MPVKLMAFFASKLSPVPASIAGPLLGGMRSDSLVRNSAARLDFPQIHLLDYPASVLDALKRISPIHLESIWENGASSFKINREGYFVEGRQVKIRVQAEVAYRVLTGLGGKKGWLYLNWLWKLRGFLDKLVGGPGLRGRREAGALVEGDILDFYRVELLEPGSRMRLKAELRAPGLGWMEWRIQIRDESEVMLTQIATFIPRGLPGFLYWYILLPVHRLVFMGLIRAIVDQAIEN